MRKLIRITTVPLSLEKLLEGQLEYMQEHYNVLAIASEPEKLREWGDRHGIKTIAIPMTRKITPFQDLKTLYKLYRLFLSEKPDIVHTHTPKAGVSGMIAAYLARVPARLHTVAGLPLLIETGLKRKVLMLVEKITFRCATHVYPNSFVLQDYLLTNNYLPKKKSKVIANGSSNGIDTAYFDPARYTDEFKTQQRSSLGIPKANFIFVFVGRLVADKGINELVEAYAAVKKEHSHVNLLLVGPEEPLLDPLLTETRIRIKEDDSIISVGYQNDIRPFLAISGALVFPSYREGFPNVVMQAGAMGLPIVATDINGCNEIVSKGINGILVRPKSIVDLKEAMLALLQEPETYNRLQDNARQLIVKSYERSYLWDALLREYQTLKFND